MYDEQIDRSRGFETLDSLTKGIYGRADNFPATKLSGWLLQNHFTAYINHN